LGKGHLGLGNDVLSHFNFRFEGFLDLLELVGDLYLGVVDLRNHLL